MELEDARDLLGLGDEMTADDVRRAYLKKSYELIRTGAPQAERDRMKAAETALLAAIAALEQEQLAALRAGAAERSAALAEERLLAEAERTARWEAERLEPTVSRWDPRSFDSRAVILLGPLVPGGLALLLGRSSLAFSLSGFYTWIHEFGHATVAWLGGYRALPLPIGWTNVSPERVGFVYWGVLFLLAVLAVAGWRERKWVAVAIAVGLAGLQYHMTWRMTDHEVKLWLAFGGIGGEFYLSTAMMGLFFVRLPAKFRWGFCRYVFFFFGAAAFDRVFTMWRRIRRGEEGIPYGSMIGGEHDAGGDMNILHEDYDWPQRKIIHVYNDLGTACLLALLAIYAWFVLRPDRLIVALWRRWARDRAGE